jgi:outer membrane protein
MNKNLIGAAAVLLVLATAAGADAQARHAGTHSTSAATTTAPPAAAQTPLAEGPAIPGMCVYSNAQALGTSAVGKAYANRMQQLQAQAAAELSGQQNEIQTEEKALVAKRATLSQEQFTQQAQPLQAREQALNQTADARTRDLRYTAAHQQQRLGVVLEPLVRAAYEQHHCSVLINGDGVMAANREMDLTTEVVTALNSRMTTITFDRETAPAQ